MIYKNHKTYDEFIGFNDFWFKIIGIFVLGFFIPLAFFNARINPFDQFYLEWLECGIYTFCYWQVSETIMIWYRKKYPEFNMIKKRIILSILSCFIAVILLSFILGFCLTHVHDLLNSNRLYHPPIIQVFFASLFATLFILTIYETLWYHHQLKKVIQEQELAKVTHIQSQLDGLRNQVNPHFLFNSLNTLNHIIDHESKYNAKGFINELSKVYRYILDSRTESTISLKEELAFVDAYVKIQKKRFMDNLFIDVQIDKKYLGFKIIPLSIQLLIENAVKHNIISSKRPLHIKIEIDQESQSIRVVNNLQKKSNVLHSTKVGLDNIKERYRLLTNANLTKIIESETQFIVSLPLLN